MKDDQLTGMHLFVNILKAYSETSHGIYNVALKAGIMQLVDKWFLSDPLSNIAKLDSRNHTAIVYLYDTATTRYYLHYVSSRLSMH
jgi:hypothetical protein